MPDMKVLNDKIGGNIVVAGVGCLGRGDDAFGPILVRRLADVAGVKTLNCGDRLEDFTADIAEQHPDTVLIADAVDMGACPGDVAVLEADDLPLGVGDTHRAPLRAVMEYLRMRTGADVLLLGVQPGRITNDRTLSPQVASSIDLLEAIFRSGHSKLGAPAQGPSSRG